MKISDPVSSVSTRTAVRPGPARGMTVVLATSLLLSGGCSGVQGFLFGRGASCGLCTRLPRIGGCLTDRCPAPVVPAAPVIAPPVYTAPPVVCPTPVQPAPVCQCVPAAPSVGCGCGTAAPIVSDPYLSGAPISNYQTLPSDPVVGGVVYPGGDNFVGSGSISGGPINSGSFGGGSRRVDYDGATILHEDPLPPGANLLP